jgi:anti-sigma regulatory factor (Ser/Thr protein kinase)
MSPEVSCYLPATEAAPASARSFLAKALDLWDLDDVETVDVLTSELVTNVVRHVGGQMLLRIMWEPPTLRVEVEDETSVLPRPRWTGAMSDGGRGLRIIECLATRWGTEPSGNGKTVWIETAVEAPSR